MITNFLEVIILAFVQGVSEFLPVSSSAHLIVFSNIINFSNKSLIFDVGLHLGSLLAVLIYFRKELINISNFIFVTADSVSMTSDALSSGKPTYVIPIKRIKSKIKKFHFNLNKENFTRVYKNKLQKWKYEKFEESKKVGKELKKYLNI